jgi:UDP-2,4-diacetamido-2,4,6-trideoxy-beta-L-altropyranose hydrolase
MNLILRADANPTLGTGHLMRCLALAHAWPESGGRPTFVTDCRDAALLERVANAGCRLVAIDRPHPDPDDLETTVREAGRHPGAALVLDGYGFDEAYQAAVKDAGVRLLVVDDFVHADHDHADFVLNQNLGADTLTYSCQTTTKLLVGPRYALLRPEFAPWRSWRRTFDTPGRRVLVTLGGADPGYAAGTALRALQRMSLPGLEALVVGGSSNPHIDELETLLCDGHGPVRLVRYVDDMAERMAWADVALSAGGTTCWELAFMGLPNAIMVLADNQVANAVAFDAAGVSVNLGRADEVEEGALAHALERLLLDAESRQAMSERGRALVDGKGAARVVAALQESDDATEH